jgi:hypothetical protein
MKPFPWNADALAGINESQKPQKRRICRHSLSRRSYPVPQGVRKISENDMAELFRMGIPA